MTDERLARIEALLEHLAEKIEARSRESDERWHDIKRTVYGDGNGYKGLLVRLDRLEQAASARQWRERALITAVIGLLAKTFMTMVA